MLYRVYIIENLEHRRYIGISVDVHQRLQQHNQGLSKWTKNKGPWSVIWESKGLSLSDARKLENRLKKQGRGKGFYSITGLKPPISS